VGAGMASNWLAHKLRFAARGVLTGNRCFVASPFWRPYSLRPFLAQFSGLSSSADGTSLYFASTLRLKGAAQPGNGKIFVAAQDGFRLFRARERAGIPAGTLACSVGGLADYVGAETSSTGTIRTLLSGQFRRRLLVPGRSLQHRNRDRLRDRAGPPELAADLRRPGQYRRDHPRVRYRLRPPTRYRGSRARSPARTPRSSTPVSHPPMSSACTRSISASVPLPDTRNSLARWALPSRSSSSRSTWSLSRDACASGSE
jgi:hypothetical protein